MTSIDNLNKRLNRLEKQERIITTSDVTIKTLAVEIKAIKMDNRQVTLAVFKQLPDEYIIRPYGQLEGIPWGRVNYHVDCDDVIYKHLHIVWQYEDILKRALALDWMVRGMRRDMKYSYPNRELEDQAEKAWRQSYTQLEQLEQLFIAV